MDAMDVFPLLFAEQTLLSLPDVPLLMVLAHLSPNDLCSAGRAAPRLAALTHGHSSLWHGKDMDIQPCETIADVLDLLRVVPTVRKLRFEVRAVFMAAFDKFDR